MDQEALTFINESHLFDDTSNLARLNNLSLSDRFTKLAADLNSLEVFSEVVAGEVDFSIAFVGTESRHNLVKRDLIVIVELTEVVEEAIEVHTEGHVASHEGILAWKSHRAHNNVIRN